MNRKFEFIAAKKGHCATTKLRRAVGVSKSTWYRHLGAATKRSRMEVLDQELALLIRKVWEESGQAYGAPRVTLELRGLGCPVNHKRVARIMRREGVFSCVPYRPPGSKPRPKAADVSDLVRRQFHATRPNQIWVCDITQIRTDEGWLYLVCFIDLYSRKVVSYALDQRCTAKLVVRALRIAIRNRRPVNGLIIHTDRGPQFVSKLFRQEVKAFKCRLSMARPRLGHCADNAVAESLWASLKKERLNRWSWMNRSSCATVIHDYITWYNLKRRHSYLGGLAPETYEHQEAA